MQTSILLKAMTGLLLTFALLWAVPAFAQGCGGGRWGGGQRGYHHGYGYGPGMYGGGPGYCANYGAGGPNCPGYGYGRNYGGRNQGRWNNYNVQPPTNYLPQTQIPAPQSGN